VVGLALGRIVVRVCQKSINFQDVAHIAACAIKELCYSLKYHICLCDDIVR